MDPVGGLAAVVAALGALAPSPAPGEWAATLDHLDLVRAAAFATGDVRRLDDVYAPGSGLAETDAVIVRDWRRRGLDPGPVRVRIEQLAVVARTSDRVELDVVDRLAPVRAHQPGRARAVVAPADGPTRRRIVLTLTGGGWRIASSHRLAG